MEYRPYHRPQATVRIRHLNRARLDAIRKVAETTFLAGRSKWEAGRLSVAATRGMQAPTIAKLASLSDDLEQEILLGLYLRAVQASDDSLIPRGTRCARQIILLGLTTKSGSDYPRPDAVRAQLRRVLLRACGQPLSAASVPVGSSNSDGHR